MNRRDITKQGVNIMADNNSNNNDNGKGAFSEPEIGLKRKNDSFTITISGDESLKPAERTDDNEKFMEVPVLPLSNTIVFPFSLSPIMMNEDSSVRVIENAVSSERFVAFLPEMPAEDEIPENKAEGIDLENLETTEINGKKVSTLGVLVRIVKMLKFPDGTVRVLVRGLSRIKFIQIIQRTPFKTARIERIDSAQDNTLETVAMVRNATKQFQEVISFSPNFPEELKIAIMNLSDNVRVVDLIADSINISYAEKLSILTIPTLQERLHLMTILLNREVEVLRLGSEIQNQVHNVMSKSQREFFLREQLKQIKEELGEGNQNPDIISINERLAKLRPPKAVMEILEKEIDRLDIIPQASGEYNIAYTYIDWLLSVPWDVFSEDRLDVKKAAEILDNDHYGLKDVKERILEFLSVLQLRKNRKSPIICFVGPPGVGKTSLGKSIASAMGRKFVRISLGGVRDEAEIRGHRRTYIGALPGRIIQGMKKAGTANPVFMLDEIDKLASDQRGDPASALLEVLDPQQNSAFNDHYLEVDYDLSTVMFIATANLEDTIPRPLLDRMEIIRLPGYTAMEKHQIAKRYLVGLQMGDNGLKEEDIRFTKSAVDEVINYYTVEAGVRSLERVLGTICRRVARKIVEGAIEPGKGYLVTPQTVRELLGPRKYTLDESENIPQTGVVTGMAWTSVGGSTLQVEATMFPGKGDLKLTGSLGDVMKESAMAAFSYVKTHHEELKIDSKVFVENDFHIHVPDGATPKDGPSAGVTLTTALVSLITNKPVKPHLSMTGEITLRGKVTAIGGVKEKVIAALRSGIRDIIMPSENEKDLEDVPDEVKSRIRFHFVSHISEVLKTAITKKIVPEDCVKNVEEDEVYTFSVPEPPEEEKIKLENDAKLFSVTGKDGEDSEDGHDSEKRLTDFLSSVMNDASLSDKDKKAFSEIIRLCKGLDSSAIEVQLGEMPSEETLRKLMEKSSGAVEEKPKKRGRPAKKDNIEPESGVKETKTTPKKRKTPKKDDDKK